MKVEYISKNNEQLEEDGYDDQVIIRFDGLTVFEVMDGLAEENHMGANFQDVHKIPELLKMAYDAGRNGEVFSLELRDI